LQEERLTFHVEVSIDHLVGVSGHEEHARARVVSEEFLREASAESKAREDADEIIRASDRAASLTAQLLALARS